MNRTPEGLLSPIVHVWSTGSWIPESSPRARPVVVPELGADARDDSHHPVHDLWILGRYIPALFPIHSEVIQLRFFDLINHAAVL